jgi:hypothetical protein
MRSAKQITLNDKDGLVGVAKRVLILPEDEVMRCGILREQVDEAVVTRATIIL